MLVFLLVLTKKKEVAEICNLLIFNVVPTGLNLLIFNVVPTGLEPVTP